ncbi:MAG: hypothetical protein OEN21_11880 [Myxococcales bacterium]|nr:hypothetical protein [Myxococcales bacterium]
MTVRLCATAIMILLDATSAAASDSCTISYRIEASLQVSDTYLSKGDAIAKGLKGSLVVSYPLSRDGRVTDGKVGVLHFAMFERFTIDAIADVTTVMHHYAPTCNGARTPTWRRPSDSGFPRACRYAGNEKPVAVGRLSKERGTIEWARCKAAPSYWSADRSAYKPEHQSKGRGCLNEMHAVGNIRCDGKLACKFGDLKRGDNPQFDVWTQPLLHGPPGSRGAVEISGDLRTVRTPTGRTDGFLSYNLPNDSPSRTWFSWVATADDSSPHTTCPMGVDP